MFCAESCGYLVAELPLEPGSLTSPPAFVPPLTESIGALEYFTTDR